MKTLHKLYKLELPEDVAPFWLFNKIKKKQGWHDYTIEGAQFLQQCHDGQYNWCFSPTQEDRQLVKPHSVLSYTLGYKGFGQLTLSTGIQESEIGHASITDIIIPSPMPYFVLCGNDT